ncbi:unnamed protein product [Closterium sp. NIES-64]|nr:unnamed protein product [Closterium sp. NIES-64]
MARRVPSMAPGVFAVVMLVALVGAHLAPSAAAEAAAAPCIASAVAGYNVAVSLGDSLILHWMTPNSTTLNLLLETIVPGWAAVGWSADGKMVGSDAVVGNTGDPPTVKPYKLTSTSPGGQNPVTSFELGETSVTTDGDSTYIKFSRTEGTGDVPVKLSGPSAIIYASSPDISTTLAYHGPSRGSAVVDFSCKVKAPAPAPAAPATPLATPPATPPAPPSGSSPPTGSTSSPPPPSPTPAQPTPSPSPPPSSMPAQPTPTAPPPPPPKAGGLAVDRAHWLLPVALIAGLIPYLVGMA